MAFEADCGVSTVLEDSYVATTTVPAVPAARRLKAPKGGLGMLRMGGLVTA